MFMDARSLWNRFLTATGRWLFWLWICSFAAMSIAGEIEDLASQLQSVDLSERRNAAYDLASRGQEALPALEQLIQALGDQDAQVWFQSVTAIGKLGPSAAMAAEAVAAHLGSDSEQRRYRAAWCLSCLGCDAIPVLAAAVSNESSRIRATGVNALGGMSACRKQALTLLRRAVRDENLLVAIESVNSLVKLQAAEELIGSLSDDRIEIQIAAASGLSSFQQLPNSANDNLVKLSQSENEGARAAAISALGGSDIEMGVLKNLVRKSLESPNLATTNAIVVLIKKQPDSSELADVICEVLSSDQAEVRAACARVLASAGVESKRVREALIQALFVSTTDAEQVIDAMSRSGDSMIEQLLSYEPQSEDAEKKLSEVLSTLGALSIDNLVVALKSDKVEVSTRAANALSRIDSIPEEALVELMGSLDSTNSAVQLASLKALRQQTELPEDAIRKVHKAAKGEQVPNRVAGILLLGNSDFSSETSLQIFDEASQDNNPAVRSAVLEAITGKDFADERYATFLASSLADRDAVIRKLAADVLSKMNGCPPRYEGPLLVLLSDESDEVRKAALRALSVIESKSAALSRQIALLLPQADELSLLEILSVLGSYGASAAGELETVKTFLSHPSSAVRSATVGCVSQITADTNVAINAILPLLKDEDWAVRKVTANQLAEYGAAARIAVPDLFRMLRSEVDEEAARNALRAIDDAGPEALEVLMQGLESQDRRIRFYAMFLIGKIGPAAEPAIPKLQELLSDSESGRFRETIQQAIDRIQSQASDGN